MNAKRLIAVILCAVMLLTLVSCNMFESGVGEDGAVYWMNFKPELDSLLQELAGRYSSENDVKVTVETPPSGEYMSTLLDKLKSENPPTMYVITGSNDVRALSKYSADLTDTSILSKQTTTEYNLRDEDGRLIAIPYCYECFGIAVNPLYVELAGHTMDELNSFDGLKAIAESIHENSWWLGYDAFAPMDFSSDSSWKYTAHLADVEYAYESRTAKGYNEGPATLTGEYMDNFKNLYDLVVNNCAVSAAELSIGSYDGLTEFKNGRAAFYIAGSWDYADIAAGIPDVTMIPLYCGVKGENNAGLCCGTENRWAINDKISERSRYATLKFMEWLVTDPDASAALEKELGAIPYSGAAEYTENGFLNTASQMTKEGRYNLSWAFIFQPMKEEYRADLAEAMKAYNKDSSDESWEGVKTAMIDKWADRYAEMFEN